MGSRASGQDHSMNLNFHVMNMDFLDVILGWEGLHSLRISLHPGYKHNSMSFFNKGKHVLFLGENNVPHSPLIGTTTKLSMLAKVDLI